MLNKFYTASNLNIYQIANAKWMMINHSTLDCHVTFSTRSLAGPERLIDTLTL